MASVGISIQHSLHDVCVLHVGWLVVLFLYHTIPVVNSLWCNKSHKNKIQPCICIAQTFPVCDNYQSFVHVGQRCSKVTHPDFPNRYHQTIIHLPKLWIRPQISFCHRRISPSKFNHLLAARIGEATNPGPKQAEKESRLTLAFCNPTAILSRKVELLNMKSHAIFLSETSATKAVQSEFNRNLRGTGFRCFYGPPVIPKRVTIDGRESFRGEAIGTAILSNLPIRKTYHTIPDDLWNTCRINASVIRLGPYEVLCVAIYGFSGNGPEHKRCNDILLARTYDYITSSGLPFIVGGDFNVPPQTLNSYKAFKDLGTVEAFEWFHQKNGIQLPATCRGSTRNDTCLLHPCLVRHLVDMDVKNEFEINIHTPLRIHFDFELYIEPELRWDIPNSWHSFEPSQDILESVYQKVAEKKNLVKLLQNNDTTTDVSLQQWSHTVEEAVNQTLQIQHRLDPMRYPTPGLPDKCRGRCKIRHLQPPKISKTVGCDHKNGFDPPEEVFRTKTKQKIKQIRRIRSIMKAINNANLKSQNGPWDLMVTAQIQHEWNIILNAPGYQGRWAKWILQFECIEFIPLSIPNLDLLNDVAQITEHDVNIACAEEAKLRKVFFHRKIHLSIQEGSSKMLYKMVRDEPVKALHEVPFQYEIEAHLLRTTKGTQCFKVDQSCEHIKIHVPAEASFGQSKIWITHREDDIFYFQVKEGQVPSRGVVSQTHFAITHNEVSEQFRSYWTPFWLRDPESEQWHAEPWSDFLEEIEKIEIPKFPLQIDLENFDLWKATIAKLKNSKAVGVCGWRHEELKLLPDTAIHHLILAMKRIFISGFSSNCMQARTVLLAKVPEPKGMHQTRPITILGSIVRLVSKLISDQLLSQLQAFLPITISGGIPNRGSKDLTLQQQYTIEKAIKQQLGLCGYTLDLVKAFNLIPRWPLKFLFQKFGIPNDVTNFWFNNLALLTRLPQIGSALGQPLSSTCGIPEGDSMSVLGMAILSSTFYYRIVSPRISPYAFADNWSWISKDIREHFRTLITILNWVHSLKMKIDQSKSWTWATSTPFRASIQEMSCVFPSGDEKINIRSDATDLGMHIHYDKKKSLGNIADRIQNGMRRLQKMEWIPINLENKAHIIQTAVWPCALYSAESQFVGPKIFQKLRRAATTTMTGNHKFSSAHLACGVLNPGLQDPLLYVISQALRSIRRLHVYHPEMAQSFVDDVCNFHGKMSFGPASALKLYLKQIGWQLHDTGDLKGPQGLEVNIFQASSREIINVLHQGWNSHIFECIQHRKGVKNEINLSLTQKVLQSLQPTEQSVVSLNVIGGFQTGTIKKLWDNEETGLCPFCQQPDDREHRIIHCDKMVEIRNKHPEALHTLKEICPEWIYLPLARQHRDVELLRTIFQARKIPEPITLHNTYRQGLQHYRCFTDGSCILPTDQTCRRSSWAVIQDIAESDDQRKSQTCNIQTLTESLHVPNLQCVRVSLTHGAQSAARAELCAIVYATQCVCFTNPQASGEFHTDSQYVCDVISVVSTVSTNFPIHKMANYDMVRILVDIWDIRKYTIHKIKAHREINEAEDIHDLWHLVANHLADRAASKSLQGEYIEIKQLSDTIFRFNQMEYKRLREVLRFYADLNFEKIRLLKLENNNNGGDVDIRNPENAILDVYEQSYINLCSWNFEDFETIQSDDITPHLAQACGTGGNTAMQVWEWLKLLKWPRGEPINQEHDPGISWFELVVNYSICAQQLLPIQVSCNGRFVNYAPFESDSAILQPVFRRTANMQAYSLEKIIRQLETLTEQILIPKYNKYRYRPCSSIHSLGIRRKVAGIARRPMIPYQQETMKVIHDYVEAFRKTNGLHQPFCIPSLCPLIRRSQMDELTAKERFYRAEEIRRSNKKNRERRQRDF